MDEKLDKFFEGLCQAMDVDEPAMICLYIGGDHYTHANDSFLEMDEVSQMAVGFEVNNSVCCFIEDSTEGLDQLSDLDKLLGE